MRNLKIPFKDMLEIHRIACSAWKSKLVKIYFPRISQYQEVTLSEEEIQDMFEAATTDQFPILERIFGPKETIIPVNYEGLKLGSKVLINKNSRNKWGGLGGDQNKPYRILLYNEEHILNINLNIVSVSANTSGVHRHATTLIQEGGSICHFFHYTDNLDYIKEVLEY